MKQMDKDLAESTDPQELALEAAKRIKSALGLTLQFVTVEDLQEIIFPEINAALAAAKTTCDQCSRKLEDGALYEDHANPQEWTAALDALVNGLVDQQAMADEWWKPKLVAVKESINAALADKTRFFALWRENDELKQQLAAERQRNKTLATALQRISEGETVPWVIATNALAKAKEGESK
jgi:hypothetical protein